MVCTKESSDDDDGAAAQPHFSAKTAAVTTINPHYCRYKRQENGGLSPFESNRLLQHACTIPPHLGAFAAQVFREESLGPDSADERSRFLDHSARADVFLGSAVQNPDTAQWIAKAIEDADVNTCFSADCAPELSRTSALGQLRPYPPAPGFIRILPDFLRDLIGGASSGTKKDRVLWDTLTGFYERNSSEDLTFLSLVLVDS